MHDITPADRPAGGMRLRDATFAVVDVETTGIDPAQDRVVEVACVIVRGGRRIDSFSSLVNPGRPIPAIASAIHHITDRHVRSAPPLEALAGTLIEWCANAVVVAHNAGFDVRFLPFLSHRPHLCSMRLAMRMIPDAPNYKNQVLRYHLGIDAGTAGAEAAHRALGDATVTSGILDVCLRRYLARGGVDDVEELVRDIAAPRVLDVLPFGRHRGKPVETVPTDYLTWLERESRSASADVRHTARCELRRRAAPVQIGNIGDTRGSPAISTLKP